MRSIPEEPVSMGAQEHPVSRSATGITVYNQAPGRTNQFMFDPALAASINARSLNTGNTVPVYSGQPFGKSRVGGKRVRSRKYVNKKKKKSRKLNKRLKKNITKHNKHKVKKYTRKHYKM